MSIQTEMVVYHQSSRAYFPMAGWLAFKDADATHVAIPVSGDEELEADIAQALYVSTGVPRHVAAEAARTIMARVVRVRP